MLLPSGQLYALAKFFEFDIEPITLHSTTSTRLKFSPMSHLRFYRVILSRCVQLQQIT